MKKMNLNSAYEILEKSSEGCRYSFSVIKEAQRIIHEHEKELKIPTPEQINQAFAFH